MHMTRAVVAIAGSLFFSPAMAAGQGAVPAPRDACALLTPAEVSAALGVNVGAGTHPAANSPLICKWIVPGANEATAKFVMMAMETSLRFKYETAPMQGRITEPLAGVGDAAVYVDTPGFSPALSVKKGDSAFQIRVFHLPNDQIKAQEKALALKVVARL